MKDNAKDKHTANDKDRGKDEDGNWVASCSAIRLIGDIPKSVYTTSSLRYGWDEVPNFKDIPTEFKVTASVSVYNADG